MRPLWLLVGLAAVMLVLLPLCCCGGTMLIWKTGPSSGAGSGSQIVGKWNGPWKVPDDPLQKLAWEGARGEMMNIDVEFKHSGRFDIKGWAAMTSGEWKVRNVEDNKLLLDVSYDQDPRRVLGWTVVVHDPNQIDLSLETTHTFALQRQN
jgi:hypothetical protein